MNYSITTDPFTGSGTTGVVCIEHGRRFQGFELRDGFAAIARARIDKAVADHVAVCERLEARR